MSGAWDDESLEELREKRDASLRFGWFAGADTIDSEIKERTGNDEKTSAALIKGDDEQIFDDSIEDPDELEQRYEKAKHWDYDGIAEAYGKKLAAMGEFDRIDVDLAGLNVEGMDEATLEEQERAALAEPSERVREMTHAALSADDAVQTTDRGQTAPQYVYDAYGLALGSSRTSTSSGRHSLIRIPSASSGTTARCRGSGRRSAFAIGPCSTTPRRRRPSTSARSTNSTPANTTGLRSSERQSSRRPRATRASARQVSSISRHSRRTVVETNAPGRPRGGESNVAIRFAALCNADGTQKVMMLHKAPSD